MKKALLLSTGLVCLLVAQPSSTTVATSPATIHGIVTDQHGKPISGALVTVSRSFAIGDKAPFNQQLKTLADGSFTADKLSPGSYSYCAQVPGDGYLNGCFWSSSVPTTIATGQTVKASITVLQGSVLKVQVLDPANLTAQAAAARIPPIMMGVWDSRGRFAPVRLVSHDGKGLNYQLTIPLDTPLHLQVISSKLNLIDESGQSVPNAVNASAAPQPTFQHSSGSASPKSFRFTIASVNP